MLKFSKIFTKLLFTLSLAAFILSATVCTAINSHWLYQYGFEKYQVSESTGLTPAELENTARRLIDYFNSDEEFIRLTATKNGQTFTLFNQRELIHLKDVKDLVWLDYRVLVISGLYVLSYALLGFFLNRPRQLRFLAGGILGGSILTLGLMAAMGLGAIFSFEQLFILFHVISFANDFWQLNPAQDYLIMLFPGGFWFDAFTFSLITVAVVAVILGVASWHYCLKSKTA